MKNAALFGVVFFIMTILAKDVTAVGWQIWYRANISYVAKNLCENKDKPKLECNGKCHLAKQLAKAEGEGSSKEKPGLPVIKLKSIEGLVNIVGDMVIAKEFTEISTYYFGYHTLITADFSCTEEHPPCEG